jgi:hypothetical protein
VGGILGALIIITIITSVLIYKLRTHPASQESASRNGEEMIETHDGPGEAGDIGGPEVVGSGCISWG